VQSARSDRPPAGGKARTLARLEREVGRQRREVRATVQAPAALLVHGLRLTLSAAVLVASIGWSVRTPYVSGEDRSSSASVSGAADGASGGAACNTGAEWAQASVRCSDSREPQGSVTGGGSGASSGSSG